MTPYHLSDVILDVQNVSLSLGEGPARKLILRDINIQVRDIVRRG